MASNVSSSNFAIHHLNFIVLITNLNFNVKLIVQRYFAISEYNFHIPFSIAPVFGSYLPVAIFYSDCLI